MTIRITVFAFTAFISLFAFITPAYSQQAKKPKTTGLRIWKNSAGKEIQASLVRINLKSESVDLKLKTGRAVQVKIEQLSEPDQKLLVAYLKDNPTGVAPPAPPFQWPSSFNGSNTPEVNYEGFDKKRKLHKYRTEHFDFLIDEDLSKSTVGKCVAVFDSIVGALDSLPMGLDVVPRDGDKRYQALLVANRATYMKLGGIPNSAGFYSPRQNLTVIPFRSLGIVKKGNNWVFDGNLRSFDTLLHELTHHAMSKWDMLPPWVQEGTADYMESMPYRSAQFLFTNPGSAVGSKIRDNYKDTVIENYILPGGSLAMIKPAVLFNVSRGAWNQTLARNSAEGARLYASSLVLTYYFMHEDDRGDGQHLIAFIHAVRAAAYSEKQVKMQDLVEKHLLRGRKPAELQNDIAEALQKKGQRVIFR